MGLFLALSGVIRSSPSDVQQALLTFAQRRSGGFELKAGTTNDANIGIITRDGPNTTVLYPDGFFEWDEASQHISSELTTPVFALHIHDGDFWMFVLFDKGEEVGHFNPVPDYWEKLTPEDKAKWKGDPQLIARLIPSISVDSIEKYFVQWDLYQERGPKAYPDDRYPVGNCWQMRDFMEKIGLQYPMGTEGTTLGDTFELWTKDFPLDAAIPGSEVVKSHAKKRPWWKFW